MYLKAHEQKSGKVYYTLATNRWENGERRTIILEHLGELTNEQVQNVRMLLRALSACKDGAPEHYVPFNAVTVEREWRYGKVALGHLLWRQYGFHRVITESLAGVENKGKWSKWIEVLAVSRVDKPQSDYALLEWVPKTALPFLIGFKVSELHENQFYRALDRLWKNKDKIEQKIWERITKPLVRDQQGIFYKDLTSTYYEGKGPPMADHGYSREGRGDCKQVNWGLFTTREGYPVTLEVYPGNTADKTTVEGTIKRVKEVFGIEDGILVGDRGLMSDDVTIVVKDYGYHYVFAEKNRNVKEVLETALKYEFKRVEDEVRYRDSEGNYIGNEAVEVTMNGVRYIVARNVQNMKDELTKIAAKLQAGKGILIKHGGEEVMGELLQSKLYASVSTKKESKKMSVAHKKLLSIAKKLEKAHAKNLFEMEWDHGKNKLVFKVRDDVDEKKRYAGMWVLITDTRLSIEEAVRIYKGLNVVEQDFRVIKSVLDVRPMNHTEDRRAEGHLFVCVLSHMLLMLIAQALKKANIPISVNKALAMMETIMLNEISVEGARIRKMGITNLTRDQNEMLKALGISSKVFQVGWRRL